MFWELRRRDLEAQAYRWCDCQSLLTRRNCHGQDHHPTWTPLRCELRICPWCARRAAARQVAKLSEMLDALNKTGAFQQGRATNRPSFKMLTLTLTPRADERAAVREICQAWRRLQLLVGFERDKRDKLFGAIAAVEIGPHRNVHLHVLYWGRFVPQALLSERWRELTGDSYVVNVHELRGSWRAAVREVCKYVTKVSHTENWNQSRDQEPAVPEVLLVDVLEAFRGRRRLMTYGLFYNVKVDELEQPPRVCDRCGKPLGYVGLFPVELIEPEQLLEYLTRLAGADPPADQVAA